MVSDGRGAHGRSYRPKIEVVDIGGRVPPHNLDIEAAILASLLSNRQHLDTVQVHKLHPEHFYSDANRRICEAAYKIEADGLAVDVQTVAAWLKDRDWLQAVGGVAYLAKLVDATPAIAHPESYIRQLKALAKRRAIINIGQLSAAEGYGDVGDVDEWLTTVESRLYELSSEDHAQQVVQGADVIKTAFQRMVNPKNDGVLSGFYDYDDKTTGYYAGELLILAARPGMGKTSFAMNIATNVASRGVERDPGDPERIVRPMYGVMIFSLEMPKEQLAMRMIGSDARVSISAMRKGITDSDFNKVHEASMALFELPLFFDDTPALHPTELRAKVRRQQREFDKRDENGQIKQKIGLVVIDYLQLMTGEGDKREEQIAFCSRSLKTMAKELKVPVIALSQLNRAVETRSTKAKRPQLSDLRESGAIEQDADNVTFLYRPEYYETDKTSEKAMKMKGYAEAIIAKQRNGPSGVRVPLTFWEEYTRFENRARDAWRDEDDD